jgi:hypothetical protein
MGKVVLILLVVLNLFLAANLVRSGLAVTERTQAAESVERAAEGALPVQAKGAAPIPVPSVTEFASVYASDPKQFAANLRRAGCPEETVRDILVAEIGRRYHSREEDLRPKPGDHLPFGWSAKTHEAKIIERRQAAAGMAREKEGLLRAALGYEVKVPMPTYAMTVSDQVFEERLKTLPPAKRESAHLANEQYWRSVEQLRAKTQGFWQSEDIAELERLKAERQATIEELQEGRPREER